MLRKTARIYTTFNETKREVSPLRKKLIEYYINHPKNVMTKYRPHYYENNEYFNLDFDQIQIEADTKLGCIIAFKDYLNVNLKYGCDSYQDETFYDIYASLIDYKDSWDFDTFNIDDIFNNDKIDEVITDYIENQFTNDTLWFEEVPTMTVVRLVL